MQRNHIVVPMHKATKVLHKEAFNPQGRCWKSKHKIRGGRVRKLHTKAQHYPLVFVFKKVVVPELGIDDIFEVAYKGR